MSEQVDVIEIAKILEKIDSVRNEVERLLETPSLPSSCNTCGCDESKILWAKDNRVRLQVWKLERERDALKTALAENFTKLDFAMHTLTAVAHGVDRDWKEYVRNKLANIQFTNPWIT